MRIAFVPIDNRPVCYTLPKQLASVDSAIEFYIPERDLLGDLIKSADVDKLYEWLISLPKLDAIVISLDTLAYGGLIPSRRCGESFSQIKQRVECLKNILKEKECKVFAFSSIMRISNNNYNEEEKEYWAEYGKKIFQYSYNKHKLGIVDTDIPTEIIEDYLQTRKRNFEINKLYLEWQKEGLFDTLVFSKDDCAEYGLNVQESQILESLGGYTKTGADEIPLSLLSRAIKGEIKVCPIFIEPESRNLISNYEDVSIQKSVLGQLELANCTITEKYNADILLYVNNFKIRQGEIVMKIDTEAFSGDFRVPNKPYMIADVRYANGADNRFVDALFENEIDEDRFFGFSAWNTSANSLGSLICGAKIKYFADKYNSQNFKKLQMVRFLDDWAYQANVRQMLSTTNVDYATECFSRYEKILSRIFGCDLDVKYKFPWNRLFEVEVELN